MIETDDRSFIGYLQGLNKHMSGNTHTHARTLNSIASHKLQRISQIYIWGIVLK